VDCLISLNPQGQPLPRFWPSTPAKSHVRSSGRSKSSTNSKRKPPASSESRHALDVINHG